MCRQFYKVVYVLGNHEYYYNEVNKLRKRWKEYHETHGPNNFVLLDDGVAMIDNVRLVGGTLWTDFDGGNWFAMQQAKDGMNDFYCVKIKEGMKETGYRKRRWLPEDAVRAHQMTLFTIRETVRVPHDGPTIVVTHHLPHPLCVDQQFRTHPLNPAYMTNLDMYIEEYDIDVWVHGHTHSNVDFEVHGTHIWDAATTAILVSKFGSNVEANPIMRHAIDLYGIMGLYMLKFVVLAFLGLVVAVVVRSYRKHRASKIVRRSMWVLNALFALIVVNNIILVYNTLSIQA